MVGTKQNEGHFNEFCGFPKGNETERERNGAERSGFMKGLLKCMGKRNRTGEERSRTEQLYEGLVELYGKTKQNGRGTKQNGADI